MATFSRNVTVNWEGSIMEGKGTAKAGSGAFNLPVSFPRRIGDAEGVTSPEELMAAAHAACFAMALNAIVGRKGGSIAKTDVTATVTADKGDAGITITTSKLTVVAHGLTGISEGRVPRGRRAKPKASARSRTRYRGSLKIELDAKAVVAQGLR